MSFDTSLVLGFLLLNLGVGLYYSRNVNNLKDYALGGRNFSTAALVSTIVATWASGSGFVVDLTKTYSKGLEFIIPVTGVFISFYLVLFIFIPKMEQFLGKNSIAEAIGELYGQKIRTFIAIAGIISSAGSIAVQFNAFGHIIGYLLKIPAEYAILLAGATTTVYSAFGGVRSVTFTDFIQLLIFGCIIPLLGIIIWNYTYHMDFTITTALQQPKFNIASTLNFDNPNIWNIIFLFCYFTIPHMKPTWFQRISMGENISQVKKAFAISIVVKFFLISSIIWIPFLIWNINPNLESHNLLSYVINNYTTTGVTGFVIIAITAMSMSTADSYINSSSVLFANDICRPFKLNQHMQLRMAKIFAFLLGIGAIILSTTTNDLLGIHILANSFYMPIATPILLLTILGYRYNIRSIVIGMGFGLLASIIWKFLGFNKVAGVVLSTMLNLIFLILCDYLLTSQSKIRNISSSSIQNTKLQKFSITSLWRKYPIRNYLILPKNELSYIGLGIYLVIYTISTMYATSVNLLEEKNSMIFTIYQIMIVSGMIVTMYPMWPNTSVIKKEIIMQISWPIIIFIELILFGSFFVMVSNFGQLQFSIFTINLILSIILLGWQIAVPMIIIGFYLSIEFFKYYSGINSMNFNVGSPQFIFIYTLLIIGTVVAIFLKPKQDQQEATEEKAEYLAHEIIDLKKENECAKREIDNLAQGIEFLEEHFEQKKGKLKAKELYLRDQLKLMRTEVAKVKEMKDEFIRNVPHETNTPMTAILSLSEVLYSYYNSLDKGKIKESLKGIVNGGDRLKSYINNIADLSKLSSLSYDLEKKQLNLGQLIKDRTILYKKLFTDDANKQEFKFDIDKEIMVYCDEYYITQAIDNLISNANKYGENKPIKISLHEKEDGNIEFAITDKGIGIPRDELMRIFDKFTVSSKTRTPAEGRGVGLALCEKIIKLHKGKIWAESDGDSGSTFYFLIPVK